MNYIKEIFLQELQKRFEAGSEELAIFVTRIREVEAKQQFAFFPNNLIVATSGKWQQRVNSNYYNCSCPAFNHKNHKNIPCKHIFSIYKRVSQ